MNASALSRQVQGHDSPRSSALSGNSYRSPSSHQEMGHRNTWSSNRPRGQTSDQSTGEQKAQAVYDISKQWGSDPSNLPTPAPQATSIMWTASQAALSNSVASVQHMNAGWGTTSGGIGTHLSSSTSQDHTDTSLRTNSVAGWGLSNLSNIPKETEVGQVSVSPPITSLSMPTTGKIVEPFGSTQTVFGDLQVSHRQVSPLDAAGVLRNQLISEPPPADKMSPVKNPLVFSGPSAREISGRNQFFESDCPSPTPNSEQAADDILSSEYNQQTAQLSGRQINLQDGGRSDPTSDSVYGIFSDGGNLPSRSDTSAENLSEKGHIGTMQNMATFPSQPMVSAKLEKDGTNAAITSMRIQPSLTPDVAQNVQHHAAVDARIKAETNVLDSASSQRSEASAGTQIRPGSHGWAPIPSTKQERQEPSLSVPERGSEWSMPSPTPTTTPSGWGSGINSISRDNQNSQFATSDGSKMPATSQWTPNTSNETAQSSVKDVQNPGWVVPTPNSNVSMGQAQGSGNIGTVIPGNLNPGWGMVPQSNVNVAWGIPAQGNSNMNVSWATPTQGNTSTNTGWSTSTPGNTNANLPWGALAQGNMIANAGLGALTQGVTTMMPTQGYPNPQPGWGAPTPGNTNQNPSWGTAGQGNTNANASSGTSQAWDPSSGSSNNWNTQQKQSGDGHSGQGDRGFQSNDAGHNTGRQSWNRSHSGGGGSRPPARGQRAGICRFHENGHCKKGANCNYFHS
ncbi:hypothetical protein J5N97_025392 [Dioscorea zingiberensis]|uniref:C3H1-type domain-containing protein n=1 Tax=Dioscorea zingiberensis TaxID=325984 RepID=A0A9D5H9U9_9LILI|nr:hypothetical protein J5N97_025392 [Dioscorea zingiberensis]